MKLRLLFLLLLFTLPGCATPSPLYSDSSMADSRFFEPMFHNDVEPDANIIAKQAVSLKPNFFTRIEGTLVVTDSTLYFVMWDTSDFKYTTYSKTPFKDIEEIEIEEIPQFTDSIFIMTISAQHQPNNRYRFWSNNSLGVLNALRAKISSDKITYQRTE